MLQTAYWIKWPKCKYPKKCGPDVSIIAGPLSKAEVHFIIDKGHARIETSGSHFFDIAILVILVSNQFVTFLHISLKNICENEQNMPFVEYFAVCECEQLLSVIA